MNRLARNGFARALVLMAVSGLLAGCVITDGPAPADDAGKPAPEQVSLDQRSPDGRSPDGHSPDDYGRPSSVNANQPGVPANIAADPDRKDVPIDARMVADGKGTLTYRAARDGTLFVVDADTDTLVFRGQINRNETFKFEPEGNNATIDGKKVLKVDLKRKDKHKIFFLRD